ncbi:hypothetical protein ACROYT_G003010 [Oculina patagonica]
MILDRFTWGRIYVFVDIRHIKSSHYPFDPISINYSNIIKTLHAWDIVEAELIQLNVIEDKDQQSTLLV